MRFELVVLDGSGKRFPLPPVGEVLIGSAPECAIRLTASDVSRRHALLFVRQETVSLLDLGSKNGTFLKGQRIKEARLSPGDLVRFSSVAAQFLPLGSSSSSPDEPLLPPKRSRQQRAAGGTDELPVLPAGAEIGFLLARWGRGDGDAMAAALEWIVSQAGAKGAALLCVGDADTVVQAVCGDVGSILVSANLPATLKQAGIGRAPEALSIHCESDRVLAIVCEGGHWLVLAVGDTNPTASQMELFAQATAVALRLQS